MPKAFDAALRLLVRRDHSVFELKQKLKAKGFLTNDIDEALAECQQLGYQSDTRFVESYSRYRMNQGFGPLKIIQELKTKGVASELIQKVLHQQQIDWLNQAEVVWNKKTKGIVPESLQELQKYQRFMLQRGFAMDMVQALRHRLMINPFSPRGEKVSQSDG